MGLIFHGLANLFDPNPQATSVDTLLLIALAAAAVAIARTVWGHNHARLLAFMLGAAVASILSWSNLVLAPAEIAPVLSSLVDVFIVLIVSLAAIPARPLQVFVFGIAVMWIDFAVAHFAVGRGLMDTPLAHQFAGAHMVVILCSALAGLTYQLLHRSYVAQQGRLAAQSRMLHSETALSFARLSAALSHELNSPLGALASSVASLRMLAAKEEEDPGADKERVRGLRRDLLNGSEKAVGKISDVISRIQRFTNLDRAEITPVQIDKMLQDVAHMVRADGGTGTEIALTTTELPPVVLKPQSISGVFSRLMHNAVKASAGRGPVEVNAAPENGHILVSVQDHGNGLSDQQLRELFLPGFTTRDGRVEASKWGLFTARQIIREHGGEISASRAANGGTRITILLPLDGPFTAT